jgi:hypothetical protein
MAALGPRGELGLPTAVELASWLITVETVRIWVHERTPCFLSSSNLMFKHFSNLQQQWPCTLNIHTLTHYTTSTTQYSLSSSLPELFDAPQTTTPLARSAAWHQRAIPHCTRTPTDCAKCTPLRILHFVPHNSLSKIARLPAFVLLVRATCSSRRVWSIGGMILRGETDVLGEKPVTVPLCSPQTPHGLTCDRIEAFAVRGRRLTAWAMAGLTSSH